MHDNLPTLLTLKNRGIPTNSTCPMFKEKEQSTSHLFLLEKLVLHLIQNPQQKQYKDLLHS